MASLKSDISTERYMQQCEYLHTAHIIPHSLSPDRCNEGSCPYYEKVENSTLSLNQLLATAYKSIHEDHQFTLAMKVALLAWVHLVHNYTMRLPSQCCHGISCWKTPNNITNLTRLRKQIELIRTIRPSCNTRIQEDLQRAQSRKLLAPDDKSQWVGERVRNELDLTRARQWTGGGIIIGSLGGALISTALLIILPPLGVAGLMTAGAASIGGGAILKDGENSRHLRLFKENYPEQFEQHSYSIGSQSMTLNYKIRRSLVDSLCTSLAISPRVESREWAALRDNFETFTNRLSYTSDAKTFEKILNIEHRYLLWPTSPQTSE